MNLKAALVAFFAVFVQIMFATKVRVEKSAMQLPIDPANPTAKQASALWHIKRYKTGKVENFGGVGKKIWCTNNYPSWSAY